MFHFLYYSRENNEAWPVSLSTMSTIFSTQNYEPYAHINQELRVEFSAKNKSNNDADLYRHHRRLVRTGQAILLIGGLVLVSHWLAHVGVLGPSQPAGWTELAVGYPMGVFLLLAGAILAGRRQP